ncbi:hypothetical protein DsansV1_C04g0037071 [Dioscorea sansibarensis]
MKEQLVMRGNLPFLNRSRCCSLLLLITYLCRNTAGTLPEHHQIRRAPPSTPTLL